MNGLQELIIQKCTIGYSFDISILDNIKKLEFINCTFQNSSSPGNKPVMRSLQKLKIIQDKSQPALNIRTLANIFSAGAETFVEGSFPNLSEVRIDVTFNETKPGILAPFMKNGSQFYDLSTTFDLAKVSAIFKAMQPNVSISIRVHQIDMKSQGMLDIDWMNPVAHIQAFSETNGFEVRVAGDKFVKAFIFTTREDDKRITIFHDQTIKGAFFRIVE